MNRATVLNFFKGTDKMGLNKSSDLETSSPRVIGDLPGPRNMPLLGNIIQLKALQFHHAVEKWAREYGSPCKFHLGRKPVLVIADHELISKLLRDRPDGVRRSSRSSNMLIELGTTGLITDEGDDWRKARKLIMRALTPEVISRFFPVIVSMTERLHDRWKNAVLSGDPIDVLRDLKAYTLDVTLGLSMGQDINNLENPMNPLQRDIEQIFYRVSRRVSMPFAYWRYFRLPVDRAADEAAKRIRLAVTGFIESARKELELHPERREKPTNMLEALIVARDEENSGFTDEHVIGNVISIVFTGEDTTAHTLAWLLNFVSQDKTVESKIGKEADKVLGEKTIIHDFNELDQFSYVEAVFNETLRLKPVLPIISLETNKDMVINDVLAPAGTLMMLCLRYASELANEVIEPEIFRPERWLTEKEILVSDDPKRSWFPFGGGPRFCPGRFLALAEMKMVVSMIGRNFNLKYDSDAPPVKEHFTFTMTPTSLPIKLSLRD
jgi:cytochrome P450